MVQARWNVFSCNEKVWQFLFCFPAENGVRANFFELFAKVFRRFRPRGICFGGAKNFKILSGTGAIRLVQKSSKSEPSSRVFGRLKFSAVFSGQAGRGPVNG